MCHHADLDQDSKCIYIYLLSIYLIFTQLFKEYRRSKIETRGIKFVNEFLYPFLSLSNKRYGKLTCASVTSHDLQIDLK